MPEIAVPLGAVRPKSWPDSNDLYQITADNIVGVIKGTGEVLASVGNAVPDAVRRFGDLAEPPEDILICLDQGSQSGLITDTCEQVQELDLSIVGSDQARCHRRGTRDIGDNPLFLVPVEFALSDGAHPLKWLHQGALQIRRG